MTNPLYKGKHRSSNPPLRPPFTTSMRVTSSAYIVGVTTLILIIAEVLR